LEHSEFNRSMEDLFDFERLTKNKSEIPTDIYAYIGDSFFNLIATFHSIKDGRTKTVIANRRGVELKRASGQKKLLEDCMEKLTDEEKEIVKKGLNSKGAKKRGNDIDYRYATAFETLVGYLFVTKNWERLNDIFRTPAL